MFDQKNNERPAPLGIPEYGITLESDADPGRATTASARANGNQRWRMVAFSGQRPSFS
jgi:hypothetical protein